MPRLTTTSAPEPERILENALFEAKRVLVGQDRMIERLFITWLARGHVLLEGAPGLAKTLAAETVARIVGGSFTRLQFTPDLVPADLVGTRIYRPSTEQFDVELGPVFANVVLADEINRAPAKVQSALLEVMAEHHVSIGGTTYDVSSPFFVLATQNPIEQEATYPLPEAQLDRFMFLVDVGYPTAEEEVQIVKSTTSGTSPRLTKVLSPEQILALQELVRRVPVPDHVVRYAVELVRQTRPKEPGASEAVRKHVNWGAGPRASQYLVVAAKARAVLQGRFAATVEDVRALALPVLRHRVLPNFAAESEGITSTRIVQQLLELVKG